MSEAHYPECPFAAGFVHHGCICDRLRTCEARVRAEERAKWSDLAHDNWQSGWEDALGAARDAVRNTPTDPRWNILQIQRAFLAAIDGLAR